MKDFNIAKYLKENHLGSHAILGRYVDLHGLKEDLSSDQADISRLIRQITAKVKYPYLGDKNAQELSQTLSNTKTKEQLEKILDDLNNPKSNASSDEIDINDPRHPNFDPYRQGSYFENRMEAEDLEGWKMVKKLATKDKSVAAAFLKPLVTVYGKDNVKIVKQGDFYKIYTKGKEELNNEADYGNNEPVDEVPYVGADKKLDGFGDEFDQVAPVEEAMTAWEEKLNYYESEVNDLVYDMMDTTGADADQIADFFQYISTQVRNHGNY